MDVFVRGLAIGLAVAAPVGPIGILCIRRTLADGTLRGICSGFGAAVADAMYALIAASALAIATVMIARIAVPLHLIGGAALMVIGVRIARERASSTAAGASHAAGAWGAFFSTLGLTAINPATILTFAGITTGVLAPAAFTLAEASRFAAGVLIGSAVWWVMLCAAIGRLRLHVTPALMRAIRYAAAAALIAFGVKAIIA